MQRVAETQGSGGMVVVKTKAAPGGDITVGPATTEGLNYLNYTVKVGVARVLCGLYPRVLWSVCWGENRGGMEHGGAARCVLGYGGLPCLQTLP